MKKIRESSGKAAEKQAKKQRKKVLTS